MNVERTTDGGPTPMASPEASPNATAPAQHGPNFASPGSSLACAPGSADSGQLPLGLAEDDLNCPICVDRLREPFVTPCGHAFCFPCITTHLGFKRSCPSCSAYLKPEQIFPNFLLNKVLQGAAELAGGGALRPPPLHACIDRALAASCRGRLEASDIDAAIALLADRKRQLQQEATASRLQLLLLFLQHAQQQREAQRAELQQQLACLQRDVETVAAHCAAAAGNGAPQPSSALPAPDAAGPLAALPSAGVALAAPPAAEPSSGAAVAVGSAAERTGVPCQGDHEEDEPCACHPDTAPADGRVRSCCLRVLDSFTRRVSARD